MSIGRQRHESIVAAVLSSAASHDATVCALSPLLIALAPLRSALWESGDVEQDRSHGSYSLDRPRRQTPNTKHQTLLQPWIELPRTLVPMFPRDGLLLMHAV